jgi:hypothetical protein
VRLCALRGARGIGGVAGIQHRGTLSGCQSPEAG